MDRTRDPARPRVAGRNNLDNGTHIGRTRFFLAPMQRHHSDARITEKPMHFGCRHKPREPIRVTQLPLDLPHSIIETRF